MKKKGVGIVRLYQLPRRSHWVSQLDSVFRALEPDVSKINEKAKAPVFLGSRFSRRQPRSEWFRIYKVYKLYPLPQPSMIINAS
jgi:hypothetical protein